MADIFLSYANGDVDRIQRLVSVLEQQGWSVWWDRKIRIGKTFDQVIEEEISNAKCMVVVWSTESVRSDWVKSEADEGRKRQVLVPVLIDNVAIPLGFRHIESARLHDWNGDPEHPELKLLLQAIGDVVGQQAREIEVVKSVEQNQPSKNVGRSLAKHKVTFVIAAVILMAALGIWVVAKLINSSPKPPTINANQSPSPDNNPKPNSGGQVIGIDVSRHTKVDWTRIDKNFVSFTMIKATQGTTLRDVDFPKNWEGAKKAGIIRGAYHFFIHNEDGAAQANFFLSTVKLEEGDLPPVLDLETTPFTTQVNNATLVNAVRTWLSLVQRVTGRKPIIYTDASFWNEHMTNEFGEYPLWIASFGTPSPRAIPKGWKTWNFWQYSADATLEGSEEALTTTLFNGSYQDLQNFVRAK